MGATENFSLGIVQDSVDGALSISPSHTELSTLTFEDYSRFKYGDGTVAWSYGTTMASYLLPRLLDTLNGNDIYVTSSAYKIAHPAAASLVEPFVSTAQATLFAQGSTTRVVPFKINRAHLTDGDYAAMSLERRKEIMEQNGLSLPNSTDISDQHVVAIDDIRVTGSHEQSVDNVLNKNNANEVTHAYVLEVEQGNSNPAIESTINGTSVRFIHDLVRIAAGEHFTVNARFEKRILSETQENIKTFVAAVSLRTTSKIITDAIGDELDKMDRYKTGYCTLLEAYAKKVTDFTP